MTTLVLLLAVALGVGAALALYLGAPSQRLIDKHLSLPVSLGAGSLLGVGSLISFLQTSGPAASTFILMTLIMSVWSALPFAIALVKPGRSRRT